MTVETEQQNLRKKTDASLLRGIRVRSVLSRFLNSLKFTNLRRRSWRTKAALLLVIAAIASSIATYAALTDTPPLGNNPRTVIWLLNIDLVFLVLLVGLIARRLVAIWSNRRKKIAGSHLHLRLVYIFSLLAAAPTIIMTVFSGFFFHFGVQTWFSERVQTAINESLAVAESYLEEHGQVIRADTMAMASDLDRQAEILLSKPEALDMVLETQSMLRNLPEIIIFRKDGKILARSELTISLELEEVPSLVLKEADLGDVVLMTGKNRDRVRALVKLQNFNDAYLFVGRMVDPKVLSHLSLTSAAVDDYAQLQASFAGMQITVTLLFVVVGLLMLLAGIWFSLILARELVNPISELISTADRVRSGDFTARVPEEKSLEEFEFLAKSFNRMTRQLKQQQDELISANRQIDIRRRLTESVLKGVSSGVIGLDEKGTISLANDSAVKLLFLNNQELSGHHIFDFIPESRDLLETALSTPDKGAQGEVVLERGTGTTRQKRTYLFRIGIDRTEENNRNVIMTFDDITDLQVAQRKAAWSDVARRIAHEIKNPLTPIQLSAERIKKKYLKQIKEDPETFAECTQTIIRHVGDIERMVNEFSSFARMPEPVMKPLLLVREIKESLLLQQQANPDIVFKIVSAPEIEKLKIEMDSVQIRQVVTNIVQNAVDSIRAKNNYENNSLKKMSILIAMTEESEIFVAFNDSGQGLPPEESPANLAEPYITHKPKGTGLGLAIVKKIIEDHGGRLVIGLTDWVSRTPGWSPLEGATITIVFPLRRLDEQKGLSERRDTKDTDKKEVA
ncbi:MAG: PAS domain-containing sensor histidine kinase [Alphaproteobacteria bacterium]|nr:PAS domain-containing sensor histidine kinase [Alphaproteobacteria bacterium]